MFSNSDVRYRSAQEGCSMPASASVSITTLFSPFDDSTGAFLEFIASAQRSIYVCIYGFHLKPLTDALIAKHQAGVSVNVILDHSQAEGIAEAAEVERLVKGGVPLLIGTSPVHGQILHSKFTIVDGAAVESGSWNYSTSAAFQSNTQTYVRDAGYAAAYLDHYHRLRAFILLHDAALQPAGAVPAKDSTPV